MLLLKKCKKNQTMEWRLFFMLFLFIIHQPDCSAVHFNPLLAARFVWHRLAAAKITLAQAAAAATVSSQQHHLQAALFPPKHTVSRRFVNKFMSHKDAFSEDHEILCQHQEVLGQC